MNRTPGDLATQALVIQPLDRVTEGPAKAIWNQAKRLADETQARAHEKLVLNMLSVDEASQYLHRKDMIPEEQRTMYSPMGVIACGLVAERVKRSLQLLFIRQVSVEEKKADSEEPTPADEAEVERKLTVDAARSLDGQMAELGDLLEKIWTTGVSDLQEAFPSLVSFNGESDSDSDEESVRGLDEEIRMLLKALLLYRKVFPGSILNVVQRRPLILSPPPSPGSKDMKMKHALRKSLGGKVFELEHSELGAALEDARDRVVDLLVDSERGVMF